MKLDIVTTSSGISGASGVSGVSGASNRSRLSINVSGQSDASTGNEADETDADVTDTDVDMKVLISRSLIINIVFNVSGIPKSNTK